MWRNWNAHELLVGIQNSTVAVEKQFGVKKKKNFSILLPYSPAIPLLGISLIKSLEIAEAKPVIHQSSNYYKFIVHMPKRLCKPRAFQLTCRMRLRGILS